MREGFRTTIIWVQEPEIRSRNDPSELMVRAAMCRNSMLLGKATRASHRRLRILDVTASSTYACCHRDCTPPEAIRESSHQRSTCWGNHVAVAPPTEACDVLGQYDFRMQVVRISFSQHKHTTAASLSFPLSDISPHIQWLHVPILVICMSSMSFTKSPSGLEVHCPNSD